MPVVCISGFSGFVGHRLTSLLEARGMRDWKGAARSTGIDLTVSGSLNRLGACDVIVNLAGRVGVGNSWEAPADYLRDNLLSTLEVMEHARRCKARVVHVSSYVYGVPKYQPIDERHPIDALNPYAASKIQSESICRYYAEAFGVSVTVLRPFNLYGPGQAGEFVVPRLIDQAMNGEEVRVHDLTPRRDYLWVDDFAKAIVAVIEKQADGFSVFNIGSGRSYSTQELVDIVLSVVGERTVISEYAPRQNELSECLCDNSAFIEAYDWSPTISLSDGVKKLVSA